MKQYELLFIVPGTLTEAEVAPYVASVEEVLSSVGATDVTMSTLGKAKLAYPMRHIRYGYFYTATFTVEPTQIPELTGKINLVKDLLRTMLNEVTPKEKLRQNAPTELVTIEKKQDLVDERKKAVAKFKGEVQQSAAPIKETEAPAKKAKKVKEAAPEVAETPVSEPEESKEKVSLEDIDKKLDEIVEGTDITDSL